MYFLNLEKHNVHVNQVPRFIEGVEMNLFSYLSTKIYVVGTQKNCLTKTILLSTQSTSLDL